ncbi:MAG TPA: carboxypeptidase-like regulatory domain-containing protein [Bryobacteraceae bacterium]|nr:carboxypeptidase-like regulatory domain-containing protein [Bryobacteraceae bacterium]
MLPCAGFGQLDRSSLNGTVTDPNGARVPGTQVTAIHSATGLARKTESSSQGDYAFDGLAIGLYTIVFSKPGFTELRVKQVDQIVGTPSRLL